MIDKMLNVFRNVHGRTQKTCDRCGRFCRETGSALYNTAWKCEHCGIKYHDRSEVNLEYTAAHQGGRFESSKKTDVRSKSNRMKISSAIILSRGGQTYKTGIKRDDI